MNYVVEWKYLHGWSQLGVDEFRTLDQAMEFMLQADGGFSVRIRELP